MNSASLYCGIGIGSSLPYVADHRSAPFFHHDDRAYGRVHRACRHGNYVQLFPPTSSHGSPTLRSVHTSTLADALVFAPRARARVPATRFGTDPTIPAPTFVSSYGETAWKPCGDTSRDPYREKSVGDRLQSIITAATTERNKAAQTGTLYSTMDGLGPQCRAIASHVLISMMALGVAFRSKTKSIAISILSGASTFVASYSTRTRGSDERRASLLRVEALTRFLHEVEASQLIHGHEVSREWDKKIDGFRLDLEDMLGGNQPGIVMINSEAAGINSSVEKGVGASDPVSPLRVRWDQVSVK
ncbi:hypothetical protein H4582DRAFT_1529303 [Lactarius indigo]|nr:hypothetical protein H4582DRAFT_1529303 [Lactarius indigo]